MHSWTTPQKAVSSENSSGNVLYVQHVLSVLSGFSGCLSHSAEQSREESLFVSVSMLWMGQRALQNLAKASAVMKARSASDSNSHLHSASSSDSYSDSSSSAQAMHQKVKSLLVFHCSLSAQKELRLSVCKQRHLILSMF